MVNGKYIIEYRMGTGERWRKVASSTTKADSIRVAQDSANFFHSDYRVRVGKKVIKTVKDPSK